MATTANQKTDKTDGRGESGNSPLLDTTEVAVKKMIEKGEELPSLPGNLQLPWGRTLAPAADHRSPER